MSTPPRRPKVEDAAHPAGSTDAPRPDPDQTLLGIAPTVPVGSPGGVPAVTATPVIAVSRGQSDQSGPDPSDVREALDDLPVPAHETVEALELASARAPATAMVHSPAGTGTRDVPVRNPFAPATVRIDSSALRGVAAGANGSSTSLQDRTGTSGTDTSRSGTAAGLPSASRFEQVPTVRAALSEQPPASIGRPLFNGAAFADGAGHGSRPSFRSATHPPSSRRTRLRWLALAIPVLAAIGFALFGDRLAREPEGRVKFASPNAGASNSKDSAAARGTMGQTTMANRPAAERAVPSPPERTALEIAPPTAPSRQSAVVPAIVPLSAPSADTTMRAEPAPAVTPEVLTDKPDKTLPSPEGRRRAASRPRAPTPTPQK